MRGLALTLTLGLACAACGSEAPGGSDAQGGSNGSQGGSANGGSGTGAGGTTMPGPLDLCAGLVTDAAPRPMSPLAKPALLDVAVDPEFGTNVRRISESGPGGVIKPMYSTIPAWNADESLLILYQVGVGHRLHDGKSYAFIGMLDIAPPDLEQVYWHVSDPDILFYVDGVTLIRYHVSTGAKDNVATFNHCAEPATGGDDPMFTSWDSDLFGLRCGASIFTFRISNRAMAIGEDGSHAAAPQPSASGQFAFVLGWLGSDVLAPHLVLDLANVYDHASLGRLADGTDTYNGVAFDPGPQGSDVGALVVHHLDDGSSRVVIGPATGYPYPPSGVHMSAMALRQPGWTFVSVIGEPQGQGVLDSELLIADTNPGGGVCRIAHHRSFAGNGSHGYWAEPHVVPSPSGTRALFGSDWGGGDSVDAYVVELPSYAP